MHGYLWFIAKRALQMLAVIFCAISATFLVTHLSPIDPVEQVLGRLSSRANLSPEAIASTRAALSDLFGTGALNTWGVLCAVQDAASLSDTYMGAFNVGHKACSNDGGNVSR